MNALKVTGLTKDFGARKVLRGISFDVAEGEIFGFLGPNGAGKTTTIRCLMDYIRPTSGSVKMLGRDGHADGVALKAEIGYVPAEPNLYDGWTVEEHVRFVAQVRGIDASKADPLIAAMDLDRKPKVRHLSTGNQQKLAIVLGLMAQPKLLILDEPTRGLDPLLQGTFHELLRTYRDEGGTVFLSSHDLAEVDLLCSRVAVIREGQLVASSTLDDLKRGGFHSVRVVFGKPVPKLDNLGLHELMVVGRTATFKTGSDLNAVLGELAKHQIVELEISRPTLEELFRGMYQS